MRQTMNDLAVIRARFVFFSLQCLRVFSISVLNTAPFISWEVFQDHQKRSGLPW